MQATCWMSCRCSRPSLPKSMTAAERGPSLVEKTLAGINPDELTPKAALEALYRLKDAARGGKP